MLKIRTRKYKHEKIVSIILTDFYKQKFYTSFSYVKIIFVNSELLVISTLKIRTRKYKYENRATEISINSENQLNKHK